MTWPKEALRAFRFTHLGEELAVLSIPEQAAPSFPPELTLAEREVCTLVLRGYSNAEIGAARRTALRTVANQVASIFRKLGITSRAELVALLTARPPP